MGFISVEQADRLFWLGRYTERVYSTLRIFVDSYDYMIDELEDSYSSYCIKMDIPNIYSDKEDFLKRYPYDETNYDSIISSLTRAYDNAIVLRESIGSETLAYIQLAVYDMKKAEISDSPLIELQKVIDNILAFWGMVDDSIDSEQIRNIIKAGKRIERIDIYARLELKKSKLERELFRMIPRVEKSGLAYDVSSMERIRSLILSNDLDYYSIIDTVESII